MNAATNSGPPNKLGYDDEAQQLAHRFLDRLIFRTSLPIQEQCNGGYEHSKHCKELASSIRVLILSVDVVGLARLKELAKGKR